MECHDRVLIRRDQRGQSAVELALAFPVLLLILMGLLDFGRAFYTYVGITNAAREGAQYGTGAPTDSSGIAGSANNEICPSQGCVNVNVACFDYSSGSQIACSAAHIGDRIGVTVSYTFTLLTTGLLPFGHTVPMSNFATMSIINGQLPAHP